MNGTQDPIVESDLIAYVDGQLDVARRIEVESHLAARPEVAARVMMDLRTRGELRLALSEMKGAPRPTTTEAARRLERGLEWGLVLSGMKNAAAVALFIGAGWLANEIVGPLSVTPVVASTPPPAYVEDAIRAHGTTVLRASMTSQHGVVEYDPADIRSATAIVMPPLPKDWKVTDVQIYPSSFGPSVEVAAETIQFGRISLFAVRPGSFDVTAPRTVAGGEFMPAYFQIGEVAYTLVAKGRADDIEEAATRLSKALY